ncbi:hypothetical protein MBLNU459_g7652t1 [Dothideomycetes sp. NU459]
MYQFIAFLLPFLASAYASNAPTCPELKTSLKFSGLNATVISSQYVSAGTVIYINGTSPGQALNCVSAATPEVDICRVVVNVTTSYRSSSYVEVWLPSGTQASWNGRFLSTGNGGLNGCVAYADMIYTTSMGFAATGDNGGHDGNSGNGTPFLNNNDVVLDFAYRSRHSAVVLGKQVVKTYYGQAHKKSYYFGCSTGGRQGLKAVQMFPGDFDGVSAGSPATDFNHLTSWSGHFLTLTGTNSSDPRFLTSAQWTLVHGEVLRQCDEPLDGVADGILEDSSICAFNPETLLCIRGANTTGPANCLTTAQVETVRQVYLPLYGLNNTFIYPRLQPSAELAADAPAPFAYLDGNLIGPATGYFSNVIYNDPTWDPTTFNALDIAYADSLDAYHGHISSYQGDLSAFRDRGGKVITYHGMTDPIISGEQSMRYYGHIASTMNLSSTKMDDFYRYFRISGMGHCSGGPGAWAFGQTTAARNASENILWDLVNWVENGTAPDRLVGTKWYNDTSANGIEFQRAHCRYPYRTTYVGGNPNVTSSWTCKYIEDWNACGGPSDRLPKLC